MELPRFRYAGFWVVPRLAWTGGAACSTVNHVPQRVGDLEAYFRLCPWNLQLEIGQLSNEYLCHILKSISDDTWMFGFELPTSSEGRGPDSRQLMTRNS